MTAAKRHLIDGLVDRLLLDTTPYLSCDACFDLLDGYVEAKVADPEHRDAALQVHLQGCPACAEEAAALTELVLSQEG
ncbi:hypothetical protein ACLM5J_18255 [Nocardioides sp. Bht2]|uniref:hypothetical protein n=1 Tax=Nocardioides sp. Bht2 TaxID=3392297 RepID=UPI0039B50A5D